MYRCEMQQEEKLPEKNPERSKIKHGYHANTFNTGKNPEIPYTVAGTKERNL